MKNEYDLLNQVHMDFSMYEEEPLTEKERCVMKKAIKKGKKINYKKVAAVAACAAVISGIAISQTAWAKDFVSNIVKVISIGQNSIVQTQETEEELRAKNEYLKNEVMAVYNENGEEIEFKVENAKILDKDGKEIMDAKVKTKSGDVMISTEQDASTDSHTVKIDSIAEAQTHIGFDYKVPEYLPEGFVFSYVQFYTDDNGSISGDYANFVYKRLSDGKEFVIMERILNEETAYTMSTNDNTEEITVNGHKAALIGEHNIEMDMNGVSVGIMGKGLFDRDTLIKIAESLK